MLRLLAQTLSNDMDGLTNKQVELSRREHGENNFTQKKRAGFFRQFLASFGDPIIKVLLAALVINILFLIEGESWFETIGIAIAIFLATFISTLSEYGSESAFARLQEDAARIQCRVKRADGIISIPITEIVVGDLVLLEAGERLPADGVMVSGSLLVDQSALNGESAEVEKTEDDEYESWDLGHKGQLFRGSVVTSGEGMMVVRRVGDHTFYGQLAKELQDENIESPLKIRLAHLAATISKLGYLAAALVAVADLFHNLVIDNGYSLPMIITELSSPDRMMWNLFHAGMLAISVIVVAVPEGLPMMITVVLSANMFRMLKDNVMVRKLIGIETAGSINILFTDKTGTLTKGVLAVSAIADGDGQIHKADGRLRKKKGLYRLISLSGLYNTSSLLSEGRPIGGNATDRALLDFLIEQCGADRNYEDLSQNEYKKISTQLFDSGKKYSYAHIRGADDYILVKGAPEILLPLCRNHFDDDGRVKRGLNQNGLQKAWKEMTREGIRVLVLAVAEKEDVLDRSGPGLTLIGLVGLRDELRKEIKSAVACVTEAGIQTVMITGDNKDTAISIAKEAGILKPEGKELVLTSQELARLSDDRLKELLPRLRLVARALPMDKSRLVRISQELSLVVGMTGDGINDAPALKKADVGFAMGGGTEVAKEASDIVILDNNFASITKAILYGRTIFKSIRKFIVFQLTMNICAVGVSLIGPFLGFDSPVTVIQMLWINIIMDTLAGLAFAGEPPLQEYMKEPPKKRDEKILNRNMKNQIVFMGAYTICLCAAFLTLDVFRELFRYEHSQLYFLTGFFALFIFCGIFNSFNARTHRLHIMSHLTKNRAFIGIMLFICVVQVVLMYYGGSLFRTTPISFEDLRHVVWLAATVLPVDILRKLVLRLRGRQGSL